MGFALNIDAQISKNMVLKSHPILAASAFNDVWGYEDRLQNEFAIIGTYSSIRIYNVTNTDSVFLVKEYVDGATTSWRDFKTYKNYLYAVCDACSEGLEIINMDSLAVNSFSQITTHFQKAHNIYIDTTNARLYVVGAIYSGINRGILVYDISTPSTPVFLKFFDDNKYVHDIYVQNNIAYASCGYSGTYVYDFTNLNNITTLMFNENPGPSIYHHSSWKNPNAPYVYSANEVPGGVPMIVYKIINNNLIEQNSFIYPLLAPAVVNARPHNPYVHENKLFISYYHDGLQVFDLKDPERPTKCAYYDTYPGNTNYSGYSGNWGVYPFLRSGSILVSDISTGLYVLDLDVGVKTEGDFILTTPGAGLIVRDKNASYKLTVSNAGNLIVTSGAQNQSGQQKFVYSDLEVAGNLILTSPGGIHFTLSMDNSGAVVVSGPVMLPATNFINIVGDASFDDIFTGPVFTNLSGRHRLICKAGVLKASKMF